MAQDAVLLLTTEPRVAARVDSALESSDRFKSIGVCGTLSELAAQIDHQRVAAILVDIDPRPAQMLGELGALVNRYPVIRIIVLASAMDHQLVLAAMHAGARHFLVKQGIEEGLVASLEELVPSNGLAGRVRGSLITVISASGGCGATTIAINLAHELGCKVSSPSLAVDMDEAYGAVASYLGLSGDYGLADVLNHEGLIDDELVVSTAKVYSPPLHVLLSPATVNYVAPAPLRYERLTQATEAFRAAYYHTVLDAPRIPVQHLARLAASSTVTLLVLQLNLKDLAYARTMLRALWDCGVPSDVVMPLVNRYHRRNRAVGLAEAEKALEARVYRLSNDFSSALRSINLGQPLAEAAPRSSLRRELQSLAAQFVNPNAVTSNARQTV